MDDEEKDITLFKVITLGDFASGKSTLIRRLINSKIRRKYYEHNRFFNSN